MPLKGLPPVLAAVESRGVLNGIYREMIRRTEGTRTPDIPYANMLLRTLLYVILDCLKNAVYEQEAQRRLIHTEDRIDDIAVICGFTNLSYFYASFKKNVGCTPMEFRKAYKNETEDQVRVNRA